MRNDYIRLIKEYIKLKPEYRSTLEEIKANVISVGVTEEEFEEAIKEVTGLPDSSHLLATQDPQTLQEQKSPEGKYRRLAKVSIFVASFVLIVVVLLSSFK